MSEKPKILNYNVIAQSRFFTVEELDLKFANGETRTYERIRGPLAESVMIIPLLDDETFLLIREYGAGIDQYVMGFPKGSRESEEELLETANRELMEEVGFGAKKLMHVGKLCNSPGYSAAVMQVIIAKDLYKNEIEGDEPEPIEVIPWKFKNIDKLMHHPEFFEARSIAGLFILLRKMHGK